MKVFKCDGAVAPSRLAVGVDRAFLALVAICPLCWSSCLKATYENPADPNNAARIILDRAYRISTAPPRDAVSCAGPNESNQEFANDEPGGAVEVADSQTQAGRLCIGDLDHWVFTPSSSFVSVAFYTLLPAGPTGSASPADTVLTLYNAGLSVLASNDDGYPASGIPTETKFSCAASGVTQNEAVLVKVSGFSTEVEGFYDIRVQTGDSCVTLNQ